MPTPSIARPRRRFAAAVALLALAGSAVPPMVAAQTSAPARWWEGDGGVGDFYRWDGPLAGKPGRLLRQEPMAADRAPRAAATARRLLYTSINGFGPQRPVATSGAVFLPAGAPPLGGWPVIAWAHGTVGLADICAPSFTGPSERDNGYLSRWLEHGYAVVASDYQGLGTPGPHPYMVGASAARAVLDAVRAARVAVPVLSRKTVVIGQSQGAHATLFIAAIQPSYAPDVPLVGAVATGTPSEAGFTPPGVIEAGIPSRQAGLRGVTRGLPTEGFDGWSLIYLYYVSSYGAKDPRYNPADLLTDKGQELAREMATQCRAPNAMAFLMKQPSMTAIFRHNPTPFEESIVTDRRYPTLRFAIPLFMGIGVEDEQTEPELQFDTAKGACAAGTKATVRFYPGKMHSAAFVASQADVIPWVDARMKGVPADSNCATLAWPGHAPTPLAKPG